MSKGINRAKKHEIYENANLLKSCVFISHKYEDLRAAKEIAACIMDAGIDIYLDDNDNGLQSAVKNNNSYRIVECIENALMASTHILVLVTENTRESWWVPYEVGYAKKGTKEIASILMKDVDEFPDYLKIEKTMTGYEGFLDYINDIEHLHSIFESVDQWTVDLHKEQLLKYIRQK
jgi:hypothetical protein